MSVPNNIFFVVSANSNIGYGHLKRCLLIAQEFLKHNIDPVFFIYEIEDKNILNLIEEKGFKVLTLKDPFSPYEYLKRLKKSNKNLIVFDSDDRRLYEERFQKTIINEGIQLMYITLYADLHYYSHYIFNPNIISLSQKFSTENYTNKLLGPDYFILEDKFKEIKPNKIKARISNLLITFGSADPANVTIKILDLLVERIETFDKVRVVIGGMNRNINEIKAHSLVKKYPNKFQIYVDTDKIYELMSKSDVAITSLGLTFWELLLHKVPALVISGSKREKEVLSFFQEKEFCFYIGNYDDKNWHKNWNEKLKFYLEKGNFTNANIEKLYERVNVNGKTKLVNTLLKKYE